MNGRKTEQGFSLRAALEDQGVSDTEAKRQHLQFIYETLQRNKMLDITRYRPNRENPNGPPHMG
jgi:hypothetical protein